MRAWASSRTMRNPSPGIRRPPIKATRSQAGLGQTISVWGHGVPADHAQALAWFRKSADQGNAHWQNGLGRLYERGWAVDKDFMQALNWFRAGLQIRATRSHKLNIGLMYQSGEASWPGLRRSHGVVQESG